MWRGALRGIGSKTAPRSLDVKLEGFDKLEGDCRAPAINNLVEKVGSEVLFAKQRPEKLVTARIDCCCMIRFA